MGKPTIQQPRNVIVGHATGVDGIFTVLAIFGFVVFIMLMSGCASMSAPQMSAEQLKAAAADKNFSAICLTFTGVGGSGKSVVVNVDQRVLINGTIAVDPNTCAVTMTNAATMKPVEPAVKAQ